MAMNDISVNAKHPIGGWRLSNLRGRGTYKIMEGRF
jgi:hypothetical protein